MSAKDCASSPLSSATILAAFTFETMVSMTEGSSSWGTARLIKRFKAPLWESEMSGGSEGGLYLLGVETGVGHSRRTGLHR